MRGPSRSSHGPNTAAEEPSITKNSVYIQPSVLIFQSSGAGRGDADRAAERQPEHAEAVGHPDRQVNGERGGRTSHRLKPGGAMMRSRERNPAKARNDTMDAPHPWHQSHPWH